MKWHNVLFDMAHLTSVTVYEDPSRDHIILCQMGELDDTFEMTSVSWNAIFSAVYVNMVLMAPYMNLAIGLL